MAGKIFESLNTKGLSCSNKDAKGIEENGHPDYSRIFIGWKALGSITTQPLSPSYMASPKEAKWIEELGRAAEIVAFAAAAAVAVAIIVVAVSCCGDIGGTIKPRQWEYP